MHWYDQMIILLILFFMVSVTGVAEDQLAPRTLSMFSKSSVKNNNPTATTSHTEGIKSYIKKIQGWKLSFPDHCDIIEVGESDVKNALNDEWLYADIKQCVVVGGVNIKTGERLLAHFSPWHHIGDNEQEKIKFISTLLEKLTDKVWRVGIVSSTRNYWDIPADIEKVLLDKGISPFHIIKEQTEVFKKIYLNSQGHLHVVFDPDSLADQHKPDFTFLLSDSPDHAYPLSLKTGPDCSA